MANPNLILLAAPRFLGADYHAIYSRRYLFCCLLTKTSCSCLAQRHHTKKTELHYRIFFRCSFSLHLNQPHKHNSQTLHPKKKAARLRQKIEEAMGKVAFVRIQNHASVAVNVSLVNRRNVQDLPKDENLPGTLVPGAQFPAKEESSLSKEELFPGRFYLKVEGAPTRRIHKDGYFFVEAKKHATESSSSSSSASSVRLAVDHSKWWSDGCHDDDIDGKGHGGDDDGGSGIVISVDIDDDTSDDDQLINVEKVKEASRIEIRIFDAIPTAKWMAHMAKDLATKPLCQVAMPGTHDSGTYKWNKDLGASPDNDMTTKIQDKLEGGPGIFGKIGSRMTDRILHHVYERLCRCQDRSTLQQLEAGIRYLDLRVAVTPNGEELYTCHGVFCVAMTEVLEEINKFLQENPKEIVLLDFNHFYAMQPNYHRKLLALLKERLGSKIAKYPALKPNSTVQEYWDAQAQIVITYHDPPTQQASDGILWQRTNIYSPWPNKNKPKELHDSLATSVKKRSPNHFFVLQGILTPDGELIKQDILENKGETSIKSIATRVSSKVVDWVGDEWRSEKHNVVIVDFFQDCSMVPAIIHLNKN